MARHVIRYSPSNSPTYASRSLGYLGLTLYECVVSADTLHRSLAGQLNGLPALPPPQPGQVYDWPVVLSAGQSFLLVRLYAHSTSAILSRVDSLHRAVIGAAQASGVGADVINRSLMQGWAVAQVIFEWSMTDGGHEAHAHKHDAHYPLPQGPGYWVAPAKGQKGPPLPLHPYWGRNRPFVPSNALPVPAVPPYDTAPTSTCYNDFKAVFAKHKTLTAEEKAIAQWWSDDPSHSAAPAGHSYNLATTLIRLKQPDLVTAAETYARVGLAVADAFINCWNCKYTYHRERPSTFIKAHIEPGWEPFWPEPPFPAFSSGHSTQAAATATVLAALYGDNVPFTDSTHAAEPVDELTGIAYKPRQFVSLWDSAVECANSRFYGGIHTLTDNNIGLAEGRLIGRQVNALRWCR